MPLIEFQYSKYKGFNLPIVPLHIKGNDWEKMWVFVDSETTYSMINYNESRRLGINPREGEKKYVKVGDGSYIVAYLVELPVKVEDVEFEAVIGFSEGLRIGFNIMGRKDFFEKFKVCFNDRTGVIQFYLND
jgi:hypothetical protein